MNDDDWAQSLEERQLLALARQEIMQLRHWYGIATDCLGRVEDAEAQARGEAIYQRIFTADADISVRGSALKRQGTGPGGWAEVARDALRDYQATQHLIGTQVVTFTSARFAGEPRVLHSGGAEMLSYVQAWHAWSDRKSRLVLGTYEDAVRFSPGVGWQIERMVLAIVSGEHRTLGAPP